MIYFNLKIDKFLHLCFDNESKFIKEIKSKIYQDKMLDKLETKISLLNNFILKRAENIGILLKIYPRIKKLENNFDGQNYDYVEMNVDLLGNQLVPHGKIGEKIDGKKTEPRARQVVSVRSHSLFNYNPFLRYLASTKLISSKYFEIRYKQSVNLEQLYTQNTNHIRNIDSKYDKKRAQKNKKSTNPIYNKYTPQMTEKSIIEGSFISRKFSHISASRKHSQILAVKKDSGPLEEFDEKGDWLTGYKEIEDTKVDNFLDKPVAKNHKDFNSKKSNFAMKNALNKSANSNINTKLNQFEPKIVNKPVNFLKPKTRKITRNPTLVDQKGSTKAYEKNQIGRQSSPNFDSYLMKEEQMKELKFNSEESEFEASELPEVKFGQEEKYMEYDLRYDVEPSGRNQTSLDYKKLSILGKNIVPSKLNLRNDSSNKDNMKY